MNAILNKSKNRVCLRQPRLYGQCGDGVVDHDEECDCGYNGNQICRPIKSDCDSPEFCKNNILKVYLIFKGYCYNGKCVNMDKICQMAYGASKYIFIYYKDESYFSQPCARYIQRSIFRICKSLVENVDRDYIQDLCVSRFFIVSVCKEVRFAIILFAAFDEHIQATNQIYFKQDQTCACIQSFIIKRYAAYNTAKHFLLNETYFKPCFDNSSSQNTVCKKQKCVKIDILNEICHNISNLNYFVNGLKFELNALEEMKSNLEYPEYFLLSANKNIFKYTMLKYVCFFVLYRIINYLLREICDKLKSLMAIINY
ncbi:hypothetical protein HZS_6787 [Henneguya salminicola]|nr:hypothetical protein HZS_6787 [Henneguya salminicola]